MSKEKKSVTPIEGVDFRGRKGLGFYDKHNRFRVIGETYQDGDFPDLENDGSFNTEKSSDYEDDYLQCFDRLVIATNAMQALITHYGGLKPGTEKQLCERSILFADCLLAKLKEPIADFNAQPGDIEEN